MDFEAPWDARIKLVTGLVLLVLAGVGVALYVSFTAAAESKSALVVLELLLVAIVVASYALSPRGYRVEANAVVIRRPVGSIRIPVDRIRRVERLESEAIKKAVRTLGNDGLFGLYGRFRNRTLGAFRMYVTDRSKLVLLEADHLYVLSPDRPEIFVETVQARLRT